MKLARIMMKKRWVLFTFAFFLSLGYYILAEGDASKSPLAIIVSSITDGGGGSDSILDYPFSYILNKPDLCKVRRLETRDGGNNTTNSSGNGSIPELLHPRLRLVALVLSAPGNFDARLAIRRTWGHATMRRDVKVAFVLGATADDKLQTRIVEEDTMYSDIIQESFLDSYRNLTLKSIMIMRWADTFCRNADHILKVDDDNFVNVPNLLDFLASRKEKRAVFGKIWKKVKPIRDKKSKWHVTETEFKGEHFPEYTGGPAYVISADALADLLSVARKLQPLPLEDVFVTGICAEQAKVSRVDSSAFHLAADNMNACTFRTLISAHGVSPSSMYVVWWYTNDNMFDSCGKNKEKSQTCNRQSRHMLGEFASFLTSQMRNLE